MLMRSHGPLYPQRAPHRERGLSLVELMIALTIGVLTLTALSAIYVASGQARNEVERIARVTEGGRYALQVVGDDLQMAGFYAEFDPRPAYSSLTIPTTEPDACSTALATLRTALVLPVQGYDKGASLPSSCNTLLTDIKANTDVIVIRRASSCVPGVTTTVTGVGSTSCDTAAAGDYQFQASTCQTELQALPPAYFVLDTATASFTLHKRDCATVSPLHRFLTRIYYVANDDKTGDGVPTLMRADLGAAGFTVSPVAEGIENLQVVWGVDSTTAPTGTPVAYTADPNTYASCSPTAAITCPTYWQAVVTAKVYLLSRSVQANPNYTDSKTYALGVNADGSANNYTPAANDHYERHLYQSTIRLVNVSDRSATS